MNVEIPRFILENVAKRSFPIRVTTGTHAQIKSLAAALKMPQFLILTLLIHRGLQHITMDEMVRWRDERNRAVGKSKEQHGGIWTNRHANPILTALDNWPELRDLESTVRESRKKKKPRKSVKHLLGIPNKKEKALPDDAEEDSP